MKRSKSDWLTLISQFEQSGLTAAAFCRDQGIDAKYFSVRKKQLSQANGFVEVKPVNPLTSEASDSVTVRVVTFKLPLNALPGWLNELV